MKKKIIVKNIFYGIIPFLVITLIIGPYINGSLLISEFILIPLSMIIVGFLNNHIYQDSKEKWKNILIYSIVIGVINFLLLGLLSMLGYPLKTFVY